jgi:hypothetical protein
MSSEHAFVYRGHAFRIELRPNDVASTGRVWRWFLLRHPLRLPQGIDLHATAAQALRHGRQQAMRWVDERPVDSRAQS